MLFPLEQAIPKGFLNEGSEGNTFCSGLEGPYHYSSLHESIIVAYDNSRRSILLHHYRDPISYNDGFHDVPCKQIFPTRFFRNSPGPSISPSATLASVLRPPNRQEVSSMGMETCCTLGLLNAEQAKQLKEAGLTAAWCSEIGVGAGPFGVLGYF